MRTYVRMPDRRNGHARPPGVTRRLVGELREQGLLLLADCAEARPEEEHRRLSRSAARDPANDAFAKRYDWAEIQAAYDSGLTMRECSGDVRILHGSSWHKAVERGDDRAAPSSAWTSKSSSARAARRNGRGFRKKRLIDEGIKEDRCEQCGITHWRGRKLSIQLHHKNGDGTDNRIENLEMLCPTATRRPTPTAAGTAIAGAGSPKTRLSSQFSRSASAQENWGIR